MQRQDFDVFLLGSLDIVVFPRRRVCCSVFAVAQAVLTRQYGTARQHSCARYNAQQRPQSTSRQDQVPLHMYTHEDPACIWRARRDSSRVGVPRLVSSTWLAFSLFHVARKEVTFSGGVFLLYELCRLLCWRFLFKAHLSRVQQYSLPSPWCGAYCRELSSWKHAEYVVSDGYHSFSVEGDGVSLGPKI